jgi:hypothetical protein
MIYYTHYTHLDALHYEWVDVISDHTSDWMIYYTHHKKTGALQYVVVDVCSDDSSVWMIYYTFCTKMGALQCVCVDVSPGDIDNWMTYCTHHRNADVQSQSPGKRTREIFRLTSIEWIWRQGIYGISKNFIIKVLLFYQSSIILNAITKSGRPIRELWVAYVAEIRRLQSQDKWDRKLILLSWL